MPHRNFLLSGVEAIRMPGMPDLQQEQVTRRRVNLRYAVVLLLLAALTGFSTVGRGALRNLYPKVATRLLRSTKVIDIRCEDVSTRHNLTHEFSAFFARRPKASQPLLRRPLEFHKFAAWLCVRQLRSPPIPSLTVSVQVLN